ncbi:MAG: phosphoadenosine phosphosulfate reductase family protein [Methanomicrobiaceae archaeon]|nr:phosphoadenosine phosphosulfate reductase family protein [Methanomicrobiaceae archaeon]
MRPSYLGKNHLHWCDACHSPVLGTRCACGSPTRKVPVTPPADIRPAFPADVAHINEIYTRHFGAPLVPPGHLVLLNKIPDQDRMEEVIMGGAVVSAIRFLPEEGRWEPLPRISASQYLAPKERYAVADGGAVASIGSGASLLAPGLVAISDGVSAGDEVFILDPEGHPFAVGRAKAGTEEARGMERGVVVRTRKNAPATCRPGPATWKDAVEANREILARCEEEAIRFIRKTAERNPRPANVSYSGGKDSLAVLLLARKALGNLPLLFADTGLEFEETCRNVEEVAAAFGLEIVRSEVPRRFAEVFREEGPPAVDGRWCCRVLKLEPLKDRIEREWGECLSFIGQRKYESFSRAKSPRVWRNRNVPNQLSAAPIQSWTALHVWLYLFSEHAPYNPLYEQRIDRIGCFMCPSSDMAVLEEIRARDPERWAEWEQMLEGWRSRHGLPPEWVSAGLWRRRNEGEDEERGYS